MTRARWRALGVAVAAMLLLGDTVAWWMAQRGLARGLAAWSGAMATDGLAVEVADTTPGGWPLAASRVLAGLTLHAGDSRVAAERAVLRLSPFEPSVLRIELPAGVTFQVPGAPPFRVTARDWVLRLPRDPAAPATLDATELRAAVASDGQERLTTASVVHAAVRPLENRDIDVVASAQSVTLPVPPGAAPLGGRVASLATEFVVHGRPPAPLLSAAAMTAWRAAGGAVLVRRFALGYGPLGISGQGEFRLDAALQPVGRASLRLVGFAETLDALAAGHVITSFVATAAGAELALLASTPPGGGAPQVETSLVVRDSVASVAGFPLLRLPAIVWAAPAAADSAQ